MYADAAQVHSLDVQSGFEQPLQLVSEARPTPSGSAREVSAHTAARALEGAHAGVSGSLEVTAITAKSAISHDTWTEHWDREIDEKRSKHERIAALAETPSTKRWHSSRARGLRVSRAAAVAHCGTDQVYLRCGCDQWMAAPKGCRKRVVCVDCDKRRARGYARRVKESVEQHLARLNGPTKGVVEGLAAGVVHQPGFRPVQARGLRGRVYMVTLTIPHQEVRGRAEELLDDAWRQLRKYAARGHWSRDCLAVLEWTPGRDGRGHPHVHVVVVSRWLDYNHVFSSWRDACEAVGAGTPARAAQQITHEGTKRAPEAAARYVAKYVAKTSTRTFSVEDWARLAAYQVGRRTVRATRGWWDYQHPQCECCEQRWVWVGPAHTGSWELQVQALRREYEPEDYARLNGVRGPPVLSAFPRLDPERVKRGAVAAWELR